MNIDDERHALWRAVDANGDRITTLETTMRDTIKSAVQEAMPDALLTDDEYRWVKLAIKRESQSVEFRAAVIQKTIVGLIWAGVIGLGVVFKEFFVSHGWRP